MILCHSKLGEKGLPFFKLLKNSDKIEWDDEARKSLEELKTLMSTPPVLTAPADQETLLYISATTHVVGTVLVVEYEEPDPAHMVQRPVYYISEVLSDSKIRYTQVQKLLYTILINSHKLHHYFQAHKIPVVSSYPIDEILHNRDVHGRVVKWSMELNEFDINFCPRHVIKSQILVDFIVEWTKIQEPPPREAKALDDVLR